MPESSRVIGFVVIAILYVVIGILAAAGTIALSRKIFRPPAEQIFYGVLLVCIALLYLAFTAYFGVASAWRTESGAVLVFAAIGLVGTRVPLALVVGYFLHGVWDALHEAHLHAWGSVFEPGQATAVPLAYGFFCATLDFVVAIYAYSRRGEWSRAGNDRQDPQ